MNIIKNFVLMPLRKAYIHLPSLPLHYGLYSNGLDSLTLVTSLGESKLRIQTRSTPLKN